MTRPVAALLIGLSVFVSALLSSCGGDDSSLPGVRQVKIEMTDSKFTPDVVDVKVGETVKLVFTNNGALRHEAVIGDEITQIQNEQQMQALLGASTTIPITTDPPAAAPTSLPGTQPAHGRSARIHAASAAVALLAHPSVFAHPGMSAANVVSVEPGATGEITFTFAKVGTLLMGCHETGHYAAGMVGTINITA